MPDSLFSEREMGTIKSFKRVAWGIILSAKVAMSVTSS